MNPNMVKFPRIGSDGSGSSLEQTETDRQTQKWNLLEYEPKYGKVSKIANCMF